MESGCQPEVVGGESALHNVQIAPHTGIHSNTDARISHDHIRQTLRLNTLLPSCDDALDIRHIGAVNLETLGIQLLGLRPCVNLRRTASRQCKRITRVIEPLGKRLADAAGGACDENQWRHMIIL